MDNKTLLKILGIVALAVFIGTFLGVIFAPEQKVDVSLTAPEQTKNLGGNTFSLKTCSSDGDSNASTSPTFLLGAGASTTVTCISNLADRFDLALQVTASSGAPYIVWNYEFSNNNVDWFREDGLQIDSTSKVTHNSEVVTHEWSAASSSANSIQHIGGNPHLDSNSTTTIVRKNVNVDPVAAKFTRVNLSLGGAIDAGIWLQFIKREPNL